MTNIPPSTAWFSRRVRQRQQSITDLPRASQGTTCFAAVVGAGWRQQQSTQADTLRIQTQNLSSRPSSRWHRSGSTASVSWRGRRQQQGLSLQASDGTACNALAAHFGSREHQSTPFDTTPSSPANRSINQSVNQSTSQPCTCTVCGSHQHLEHECFIAHGVPARVRMQAGKVAELVRLHGLYVQGAFDWRTTPTSLAWMLRLREKHTMPARPNPDPNPNHDDTYSEGEGEEDMHGPGSMCWAHH